MESVIESFESFESFESLGETGINCLSLDVMNASVWSVVNKNTINAKQTNESI